LIEGESSTLEERFNSVWGEGEKRGKKATSLGAVQGKPGVGTGWTSKLTGS